MNLRVQFHGMTHSARLQQECQELSEALVDEFPEVLRCEVTLGVDAGEHRAQVHITGKEIDLAAHATGDDIAPTAVEAFEKARRQLRKHHDKRIDSHRR